jgi:hypothetical protein
MDWLAPDRVGNFHALLREEIPAAFEGWNCSAGFSVARATAEGDGSNRELMRFPTVYCSRGALSPWWERARRLSTAATALLILLLLLSSCVLGRHRNASDNLHPGGPWGYYSGNIDTRWDADGRTMTLLDELRYTDPKGVVWIAPAGSVIDGASIPRALWSFMGGPFEGKYRNASVLHDVAYDQKNRPPPEVDRMFYNAMRCSGVGAVEAKTMYYALLRFGRHWKFTVKKAKPVLPDSSRDLLNPQEPRSTTLDPNEVGAIQQWIRQNNPTLDQIESRADSKGR